MEVHMKKYLVLTVLLILLATPLLAQDADHHPSKGQMPMMSQMKSQEGHFMMKQRPGGKGQQMGFPFWMAEELGLTEVQIDKIDEYQDDSRKASIDVKADIGKLEIDKKNTLEDENYKETRKIIDQIYLKKATLAKEQITLKEKISSILTEDQKDKLESLLINKIKHKDFSEKHPEWHK